MASWTAPEHGTPGIFRLQILGLSSCSNWQSLPWIKYHPLVETLVKHCIYSFSGPFGRYWRVGGSSRKFWILLGSNMLLTGMVMYGCQPIPTKWGPLVISWSKTHISKIYIYNKAWFTYYNSPKVTKSVKPECYFDDDSPDFCPRFHHLLDLWPQLWPFLFRMKAFPSCKTQRELGAATKWQNYSMNTSFLVGGWPTPLKNMKFNGKDDIPYIMENKKCSKPPTSFPLNRWCWRFQIVTG